VGILLSLVPIISELIPIISGGGNRERGVYLSIFPSTYPHIHPHLTTCYHYTPSLYKVKPLVSTSFKKNLRLIQGIKLYFASSENNHPTKKADNYTQIIHFFVSLLYNDIHLLREDGCGFFTLKKRVISKL